MKLGMALIAILLTAGLWDASTVGSVVVCVVTGWTALRVPPTSRKGMRRLPKLPVEEVPLDPVEQGRHRRQDARSANQGGSQPQNSD
jgi:hypothetical protein